MSQNQQEQSEAKLLAYLEGELDPAGVTEIEKHLEAHPQHRKLLEDLKGMRDWVRWLPREAAPPELVEEFQGQLERSALLGDDDAAAGAGPSRPSESRMRIGRAGRVNRWPQVRAAAAVAGLAAGLGVIVYFSLPSLHNNPYAHLPSAPEPKTKIARGPASGAAAPPTSLPADSTTSSPGVVTPETTTAPSPALVSAKPSGATSEEQKLDKQAGTAFAAKEPGSAADTDGAAPNAGPAAPMAGAGTPADAPTTRDGDGREALALNDATKRGMSDADARRNAEGLAGAPAAPTAPAAAATAPTVAEAEAMAAAEPSAQLEEVARQFYLSSRGTPYFVNNAGAAAGAPGGNAAGDRTANGTGLRLERAEVGRRALDRAGSRDERAGKIAEPRQALTRQPGPLVMVVLAPNPDQAREQISEYCATNNLPARLAPESAHRSAGVGTDVADKAAAGAGPGAMAPASPAAPAPAAPAGPGAMAKSAARPEPAPFASASVPAPMAPAPMAPPPMAPPPAAAKGGSRGGEAGGRDAARSREEKKLDNRAAPRPGSLAATPPAAAPVPARPGTFGGPSAPGGVGGAGAGGAVAGTAGGSAARGVGMGQQRADQTQALAAREQAATPQASADQISNNPLDNSPPSGASGRKTVNVPNLATPSPVVVRMTARQASDLQAALSRPVASQWAAVYDGADASGFPEGSFQESNEKRVPEALAQSHQSMSDLAARRDGSVPTPEPRDSRVAASGGERFGKLGDRAATQPATPAQSFPPADLGRRSPAVARTFKPPAGSATQAPAAAAAAPGPVGAAAGDARGSGTAGSGATQADSSPPQQQFQESPRHGGAPTTAPTEFAKATSDDDQPVDVVILLQQSPQATQADGAARGPATEPSGTSATPATGQPSQPAGQQGAREAK